MHHHLSVLECFELCLFSRARPRSIYEDGRHAEAYVRIGQHLLNSVPRLVLAVTLVPISSPDRQGAHTAYESDSSTGTRYQCCHFLAAKSKSEATKAQQKSLTGVFRCRWMMAPHLLHLGQEGSKMQRSLGLCRAGHCKTKLLHTSTRKVRRKLLHCGSSMLQDAVLMVSPSRTRGSYSISSAAKTLQKIFVGLSSFTAGLIMPCTTLHVLLAHCASADASNPPSYLPRRVAKSSRCFEISWER